MEPMCEFCGVVRAVVYCKSDLARLCLHCDGCVHSANTLSRRHPRSLLCDKCNTQAAIVRCIDEKISLCQNCDWNGGGCSSLGHRCQVLDCYTGCPSSAEFTRIWSSVLDVPENDTCRLEQRGNDLGSWMPNGSSIPPPPPPSQPNYMPYCADQSAFFSDESNKPKV